MKKRIAIIGTVGVPAKYGGFETLVENLLNLLPDYYEITVFCEANAYNEKLSNYKGAKLVYLNIRANGLQSIIYDITSVLKSFRKSDILIIMGVSGTIILPFIKPFNKSKIITNIDGLEWKRKKWNTAAKYFLKFSEMIGVFYSDYVVADNLYIKNYLKKTYNKQSFLISYGGDHVQKSNFTSEGEGYGLKENEYLFTVCRIEPENNLEMMVNAYIESRLAIPYVIIGNFASSKFGQEFRTKYSQVSGVILLDPIYDQKKLDQLRSNCYFYLHGHSAGGTNPSLVEAMFLQLPIIAYGVNYNKATTNHEALYFLTTEELVTIFKGLSKVDREKLKRNMGEWAEREYKWNYISSKYLTMLESSSV